MGQWGTDELERMLSWEQSPQGAFALWMENRLLLRLMSAWPRRHQNLLEIGCGPGYFLKVAWESGFCVSGLDNSRTMLQAARERLNNKVELHLGSAESLPFADKDFDFVLLSTVLECAADPQTVLSEACRVARKGLVLGFLNPFSLYYLQAGLPWPWLRKGLLRKAKWLSWFRLKCMILREVGPRPMYCRSVLPGPFGSWRNKGLGKLLNSKIYPPSIGAYQGVRIDLVGQPAKTPLLGWVRQPAA